MYFKIWTLLGFRATSICLTQFVRKTMSHIRAADMEWRKTDINWFPIVTSIKTVTEEGPGNAEWGCIWLCIYRFM